MLFIIHPSSLSGNVRIPGSKSHTIRAILLASMADGQSVIRHPLVSNDTLSALQAAKALGAQVVDNGTEWLITGVDGKPSFAEGAVVDVGNSGTTLFLSLALAGLADRKILFDGDAQIRQRSASPLLHGLSDLGIRSQAKGGCCPIQINGPALGGKTEISCQTSQYLSGLLIAAPLMPNGSEISVPLLRERPYVEMTLAWLETVGAKCRIANNFSLFTVPGGQRYKPFDKAIAGDFSSAAFFLVAAAITGSDLVLEGLDLEDRQGDKEIINQLRRMGARIEAEGHAIHVYAGGPLSGCEMDLSDTPDALPILAVAGATASGVTKLVNVAHARLKETDRIAVMAGELSKLGIKTKERPDGLEITGGKIEGGHVHGHGDHRVVMSLAVAGLVSRTGVTVDTAEAAAVTFPEFSRLLAACGAKLTEER